MKKKTALVTGACGMDGSHLCDLLLEKEYRVVGMIRRNATRDLGNIAHLESEPDMDIIEGDVTDMSSMMRILQTVRPHEIYNMAAMSHVHTSFEQPLATLDIDTKGVVNLLEGVLTLGRRSRLFHASTSEMFGDQRGVLNERAPLSPRSPYGIAKIAAHHLVEHYRGLLKNRQRPIMPSEQVRRFLEGSEFQRVLSGEVTPTEYHKYQQRMLKELGVM